MTPAYKIPRRNRLDQNTPIELALYKLGIEIEQLGAHPLLTDAICLVAAARDKVADYVDEKEAAKND